MTNKAKNKAIKLLEKWNLEYTFDGKKFFVKDLRGDFF